MQFPHSCILYLRGSVQEKNVSMELQFPDNQVVRYEKMKQQLENHPALHEQLFQEYRIIADY